MARRTPAPDVADDRVRRLLDALELERAQWAAELHDHTLQGLGALAITLAPVLRAQDADGVKDVVRAALDHLGAEIAAVRHMISELRPALLDDVGLGAAIEALAARMSVPGGVAIDCDIRLAAGEGPEPGTAAATTVYRIVQEALSNVVRHAAASCARVTLEQVDGGLVVRVADDGDGFDLDAVAPGFGLVIMRERIVVAGGRLALDSGPHGTDVWAWIPVARPPAPVPFDGAENHGASPGRRPDSVERVRI